MTMNSVNPTPTEDGQEEQEEDAQNEEGEAYDWDQGEPAKEIDESKNPFDEAASQDIQIGKQLSGVTGTARHTSHGL